MPTAVSDSRSNANDQIAHAVKVIGKSQDRLAVFEAIYHGKGVKDPDAVATRAKMSRKRVLEEAVKLTKQHVVIPVKDPKRGLLYAPDSFYDANKKAIVGMVRNPKKAKNFPTKVKPHGGSGPAVVSMKWPRKQVRARIRANVQAALALTRHWRMGWDSNPRYPCGHAGFQDRCLKPLGHPSTSTH